MSGISKSFRKATGLFLAAIMVFSLLSPLVTNFVTNAQDGNVYGGPTIGEDGQVTFYYQGNGSEGEVYVKGSWDWDNSSSWFYMVKGEDNLWSVTTTGLEASKAYEYGIVVDGNWVGDPANTNSAGNSKIVRNPVVNEDESVTLYYYPEHSTYPEVKVQYRAAGSGDEWTTVSMGMDGQMSSLMSVNFAPGTGSFEYQLVKDGQVITDVSAAAGQVFTVSSIPQADPSVVSPEVNGSDVTFNYYAPTASAVYLAGSMNGWSNSADAMVYNEATGYWSITKTLSAGTYEYKFVADGSWINDPLNTNMNEYGNNLAVVEGSVKSPVINSAGVTFNYYSESASSVQLAGSMTNWLPGAKNMVKDNTSNYWTITLPLPAGDYQYQFIVDGNWTKDPLNPEQSNGDNVFTVSEDAVGISPVVGSRGVKFVYAGTASKVQLAGTMTGWQGGAVDFALNEQTGLWELERKLTPGIYEYKFILDGNNWINDPENTNVNAGGNNVLIVPGLADQSMDVVAGNTLELPDEVVLYSGDGRECKVNVEYAFYDQYTGVTLDGNVLSVSSGFNGNKIELSMNDGYHWALMTVSVVAAQYNYTIYYYDPNHQAPSEADLWIWENGGAPGSAYAFTEAVELEDGNTWLKAEHTLSFTNMGIIPRSKGEWAWQSATVNYVNAEGSQDVSIYIIADDSTAYTELPEIEEVKDRYLLIEYDRPDGDYEGWNIYTWNSGFGSEVSIDFTEAGGKMVAYVPIKPTTTNVSFVMRRSEADNVWAEKDGGDNNIITPIDQTVIKAVFTQGSGVTYLYPYNKGYEIDAPNGRVNFYYRDDDLALKYEENTLEGNISVEVDGQLYPMTYDEETDRFVYVLDELTEGEHRYRYLIGEEYVVDPYADDCVEADGEEYSVYSYYQFDADVSANVAPEEIDYNMNAILNVSVTGEEGMNIVDAWADVSALGGSEMLSISPELMAVTISVKDTVAAGVYEIPVTLKDQYGNVYTASASVTVKERTGSDFDWDEAIIYFMVTDRFYDGNENNNNINDDYDVADPGKYHGGDFAGVTEKLDYLADLGINTIWITPVVDNIDEGMVTGNADVPATYGYHGYWASDFTQLNPHLGNEEEFRTLIEEAHNRGIRIMVDVVLNHAGYNTENIFGDMIRGSEDTVSGDDQKDSLSGLPDFLTENPEVRQQLVEWQTEWIRTYDIDYFRVDTVKHVDNTTWQALKNSLTEENPEFKMIGEYSGAGYSFDGGQLGSGQMDSLLDFDFNNLGIDLANGYLSKVEQFLENRNEAIDNTGTLGGFLGSHDEDGLVYDLINDNGFTEEEALAKMMVAASMQMTAKGQPVIYYGEEIGLYGANDYPYQTNRYDFDWSLVNEDNKMLNHYKTMLGIRNDYSILLSKGDRTSLAVNDEKGYMVFDRSYNGKHLITALNVSDEAVEITFRLPEGADYTAVTNLYDKENTAVSKVTDGMVTITIPAAGDGGTYVVGKVEEDTPDPSEEDPSTDPSEEDPSEEDPTADSSEEDPTADSSEEDPTADSSEEDPTADPSEEDPTEVPSTENPTEDSKTPGSSQTPGADTGDNVQPILILLVMLVAGGAVGAVAVSRRRSHK